VQSVPLDVFFSCSFQSVDAEVNDFFMAIGRALSMRFVNVSTGSPSTPPADAKAKIEHAQAVLAVCTRRTETVDGKWIMPGAVHDEISIAYGSDTPLLMIIEDGVDFSGFKSNFGTYLTFTRGNLHDSGFLQQAVEAVHNLKLHALGENQHISSGLSESYADFVNHMVELRPINGRLTWQYSTTKKLVYTHPSKRSFPSGVWATVPVRQLEQDEKMGWRLVLRGSSRGIVLEETIEKHTASCVETRMRLSPAAEEGDHVEYFTQASSPYINPIWAEDVEGGSIHLNSGSYKCADGLIFIHRTKRAIIEFRIDQSAGLGRADLKPFVGSYTSNIDYEVESELKRCEVRYEDFGGTTVVRMEIDSPLPGHMYGIAWNPKPKPPVSAVSEGH
jgi:hypothetical protein